MNLRFYIDPKSNEPHIYKHSVTESEVEDVLRAAIEDRAGRYLRVIYVRDQKPHSYFVITAFPLGGKALRALRRRTKNHQ